MPLSLKWVAGDEPSTRDELSDRLRGHRSESWRVEMLNLDRTPAGVLDGCQSLSIVRARDAKASGSLGWVGTQAPNWIRVLLKPIIRMDFPDGSAAECPLGLFVPATPGQEWDDGSQSLDVDLYDRLLLVEESENEETLTVDAGAVVTTVVRSLLAGCGITTAEIAITDSPLTLPSAMTFEPETSCLAIINKLLGAINYTPLRTDGDGVFDSGPYIDPKVQPVVFDFHDTPDGIYAPKFTRERDSYMVPNRVIGYSRSEGGWECLRSVAVNVDPDSDFSFSGRGDRWISKTVRDIDAVTQDSLDGIVERILIESSQVASKVSISHWFVPLSEGDVVAFGNSSAGVDIRALVEETRVELDVDGFAEASSKIQEIL